MEYVYSLNEEDWNDLDSIMDDVNENNEPGTEVELLKGESHPTTHDEFVNAESIVEMIQERAYDDGGEHAEDYLDEIKCAQLDELKTILVEWLNKNAKPPRFYRVLNTVKETVIAEEI